MSAAGSGATPDSNRNGSSGPSPGFPAETARAESQMASDLRDPGTQRADPVHDSGLRCLECDYNLTGLTGDRCPECGATVDWGAVRRMRDVEAGRRGTYWEQWPWRLKPLGFFATAGQAAFVPWLFARQLPSRPRLVAPLSFLAVCMVIGSLVVTYVSGGGRPDTWLVGVVSHVLLQTFVFGLSLPVLRVGYPFRFWLAVTCYTSYPLLLEGLDRPPYILPFHRASSVWPFTVLWNDTPAILTSVLYYVWWIGLSIIAYARLPRRHVRRVVLLVLAVFAMTVVSSYSGCYVGDYLANLLR